MLMEALIVGNEEKRLQYLEVQDLERENIADFQGAGILSLGKTTRSLSLTWTYDHAVPICEPNQHRCVPGTWGR